VNQLANIVAWLTQHPLSATAFFFGGSTLAVLLYTYVHDYKTLIGAGMEERR